MQWLHQAIAVWALIVASIALWNSRAARRQCNGISAGLARLSGALSEVQAARNTAEPLTASQLAELAELRDAVDKGNALLKRIASREAMRDRRDSSAPTSVDRITDKDQLRRIAGLRAGVPAQHNEGRP